MVLLERGRIQRLASDGEVICPAYTFFATVTPLLHLGAIPVLADCDANGNLDPADAARKVTEGHHDLLA